MNDHRGVIVGVCKASRTFQTFPIIYTRYTQATQYAPGERKVMSFVLAEPQPGVPVQEVCERIDAANRPAGAHTSCSSFGRRFGITWRRRGFPLNFGITVLLGVIVGTAISGQTFYLFTVENLKQFGASRQWAQAIWRIVGMVLLQAIQVGFIGYCLGIGGAAAFGFMVQGNREAGVLHALAGIGHYGSHGALDYVLASLLCVRKVITVEPAIVFKG